MRNRLVAALAALLATAFLHPAVADAPPPNAVYAKMPAHPALWTVHGPKGTAYLFGSFHFLPPNVDWHTKEIDAAMARANVLVFELKMDDGFAKIVQAAIRDNGMLPAGEHLRDKLSPKAQAAFDRELADLAQPLSFYDGLRPWLAAMMLEVAAMRKQGFSAKSGIELTISPMDKPDPRPTIGLETAQTQLALLMPGDPKTEIQAFEQGLEETGQAATGEMGPLLDAWMHGDVKRLDRLTSASLKGYPQARKAFIDDRNAAWVEEISGLLAEEKIYFITVGAAHLVGPNGVPNLLRAKGFKVDGP